MLAVLEDAIFSSQRYLYVRGRKERRVYEDAADWIFDRRDTRVFSFENICATCGLDPDYLRMGLSRWQAQTKSNKDFSRNAPQGAKGIAIPRGMRGAQTVKLRTAARSERSSRAMHGFTRASFCDASLQLYQCISPSRPRF